MSVTPFRDRQGAAHFECVDCGTEVFTFGRPPTEPVCAVCQWIRDTPMTEEDRAKLRDILGVSPG